MVSHILSTFLFHLHFLYTFPQQIPPWISHTHSFVVLLQSWGATKLLQSFVNGSKNLSIYGSLLGEFCSQLSFSLCPCPKWYEHSIGSAENGYKMQLTHVLGRASGRGHTLPMHNPIYYLMFLKDNIIEEMILILNYDIYL